MSRRFLPLLIAALALAAAPAPLQEAPLAGFTPESGRAQRALERRMDAELDPAHLREWMRHLTRHPFYIGSPGQKANAEWIAERFREWGYDTRIETYQVLFPTPRDRLLEMTAPVRFRAQLEEPVLKEDPSSGVPGRLPSYNAYSADGDVEAELVYVNYGGPADYEELARRGIDVRGKIVIARYGENFRGIKPKVAAEHGAIGAILYSDPRDDGYFQGDVYPEGPYRMDQGVQRGSVVDLPQYAGDPLTPFRGATADAERLARADAPSLPSIPVLPISYADAQPLLAQLGGQVAPTAWRGALPITYHIGPGPARVHIRLAFNWDLAPAMNVIATLRGTEHPDEWVVRGNHADGWAMGAADPISGLVSLMEEARAVGELARAGERPKRTIVYAAWDGEEVGLLGSTEWAEDHGAELREKAVAYVNTDGNGRGFLSAGGSHTLERLVNEIAKDITDPQTSVSLWERLRASRAVASTRDPVDGGDLRIDALGSGSDYTGFLQHLGIASLNFSFGGESGGGSYHSQYDSFEHYTRFIDPDFAYGIALSKVTGRATLRLANADVLPFRITNFAKTVRRYTDEVTALADSLRTATERTNRLIRTGDYKLAANPTETLVVPDSQAVVPYLTFAPMQNALARLDRAAAAYDEAVPAALAAGGLSTLQEAELDRLLISTERLLTLEQGLPRRPWFRHQVYAPGFYTGYGVKTLPGIRESLEQREFDQAAEFIGHAAGALEDVSEAVERATALLRQRILER